MVPTRLGNNWVGSKLERVIDIKQTHLKYTDYNYGQQTTTLTSILKSSALRNGAQLSTAYRTDNFIYTVQGSEFTVITLSD